MKKIFLFLLVFALTVSMTACLPPEEDYSTATATTDTAILPQNFVSPKDETPAIKTFSASNEDGLVMEIILHGYASKTLGEKFYVKSNEYFRAQVKITNTSDQIYQQNTYACHGDTPPHNHELEIDITDGNGHALVLSYSGFMHPDLLRPWDFKGKTFEEWDLRLAAGEEIFVFDKETEPEKVSEIDLVSDGQSEIPMGAAGVALYGKDIYTNGELDFSGTISFAYSVFNGQQQANDRTLSCPISVKIVYVPFQK